MAKVLVVGGTGFIGKHIVNHLRALNDVSVVRVLSRTPVANEYEWNVESGTLDTSALEGISHCVFVSGASIADERITDERMRLLRSTRLDATRFLIEQLSKRAGSLEAYVSASAIGFYGHSAREGPVDEDGSPGADWAAQLCVDWEREIGGAKAVAKRVITLRVPPVLGHGGGPYPKMAFPARWGLASSFGSGSQPFSWIHVEDLAALTSKALLDPSFDGVYNAVAPNVVSNLELTAKLAKSFGMPYVLPNLPSWALSLGLGAELTSILVGGVAVKSKRLSNFPFKYPELDQALANLRDTRN